MRIRFSNKIMRAIKNDYLNIASQKAQNQPGTGRLLAHLTWIFCFILFLSAKESGCKQKSLSDGTSSPATEVRQTDFLLRKLQKRDVSGIKTLSAKAQILIDNDGQTVSANANIIWIRDSVVWINIKKFGIEAVRALVTRDSAFILNRFEKTYTARGLESLQREYNLPAGFSLLQECLLAAPWFFPDMTLNSGIEDGLHELKGSNGRYSAAYAIAEGSFLLQNETFIQQKDSRIFSMGFDQYNKLPGADHFPYLRHITAYSPDTGSLHVDLDLSEIEINVPKAFRFEIPEHYERAK